MPMTARSLTVPSPQDHVVTAQEALEPLYEKLEQEAEVQIIAAAVRAGWTPEQAISAIEELRRSDVFPMDASSRH